MEGMKSRRGSWNTGQYGFTGAGLKAAQDVLQRRSILEAMTRGKRATPCYAGRLNVVLTETGDVYPCESFDLRMGNVREESCDIARVLRTEASKDVLGRIRRKECCCTHECYHMTNILFNPACYPALLGEYLGRLRRNPDPLFPAMA
jgi:radical SAM protein with 4Fe4S-binding SPASM domain